MLLRPIRTHLTILALAASSCTSHLNVVRVDLAEQVEFVWLDMGFWASYVIDPRTRMCALKSYENLVKVDCASLYKTVPEARPHLAWLRPNTPTQ